MPDRLIQVAEDFWNLRGSFKIGGIIDIKTQISLVRLPGGGFVALDSYTLGGEVEQQVDALTDGGKKIEAILNLHPFHTIHVRAMHERFPQARLYGTARHVEREPSLPWEELRCEDPALHEQFATDFEFSVPRGVDFISSNPNLHFSSVLALHRGSKTIHVDDTFMYMRLPPPMAWLGHADTLSFHPTLAKTLERRAGAAADFRHWAGELAERWGDARNLCAAHTAALLDAQNEGASVAERMRRALVKVEKTLARHERKYS